ncbi:PhoH family protein [Lapidilactobacillus achengensis]|uniref:PhoH-like protein n=1 Tax=Lapidilactobacillus achengensis TaxID=2486000 RepID=A0ABW1UM67_9LACO|nr:PhoH family protein [Lapidilactobacillus achengensis]
MVEETSVEKAFTLTHPEQALNLLGVNDEFLHLLEEDLNVELRAFAEKITITGPAHTASLALQVLEQLAQVSAQGITLSTADVQSALKMAQKGTLEYFSELYQEVLIRDSRQRPIRVKNLGQRQYVQSVRHNEITFGVGPAGTGKTFLAVVLAVSALKSNQVQRIILTRPAVEAGESLGFLPGDLKEKIDPYLRPLYDALYTILGTEQANRMLDRGIIEIAPLAYMRGRTLEEAFVILDEAQNTTTAQMKMFLTRLGINSKMIINGDLTQVDLPHNQKSGLRQATEILQQVKRIGIVRFSSTDVVRHPVVAKIIDAYEKFDQEQMKRESRNH